MNAKDVIEVFQSGQKTGGNNKFWRKSVGVLVERIAELEADRADLRHDLVMLVRQRATWKRCAKKMFAALKIIMTTIADHVVDDREQLAALYQYDDLGVGVLLDSAEAENDRLREALQFYADESNYDGWVDPDYQWSGEAKDYPSDVENDRGETAREALGGDDGR